MALFDRDRDFTEATLQAIRTNLRVDSSPYNDLSRFWINNGDVFDFADPTDEIRYLENSMSELRFWMSETALQKLDSIETSVRQLDSNYASRCNEVTEEIATYGRVVDILIGSIGSPDFVTSFNKADIWEKINEEAPQLLDRRTEKQWFFLNMAREFGFDLETIKIMWKVWEGIVANNPTSSQRELDWMFIRALSQFCYNEGDQLKSQWRAGAGYVCGYGEDKELIYFLSLGLSIEEFNLLRYKIRVQHEIVGLPEEFSPEKLEGMRTDNRKEYLEWKSYMEKALGRELSDKEFEQLWRTQFSNFCTPLSDGKHQAKADFAHMMYTLAGCYADKNTKGVAKKFPPFVSPKLWDNPDTRKQIIGWLGDATIAGSDDKISFGPDDYAADLDADNIYRRMEKNNSSYFQESMNYYEELNENPQLRAQEFEKNNDYASVEKAVLDGAHVKSLDELKAKDGWSDSYDFLMSLKNNDPVIRRCA